jgi:hypothetical protein
MVEKKATVRAARKRSFCSSTEIFTLLDTAKNDLSQRFFSAAHTKKGRPRGAASLCEIEES